MQLWKLRVENYPVRHSRYVLLERRLEALGKETAAPSPSSLSSDDLRAPIIHEALFVSYIHD